MRFCVIGAILVLGCAHGQFLNPTEIRNLKIRAYNTPVAQTPSGFRINATPRSDVRPTVQTRRPVYVDEEIAYQPIQNTIPVTSARPLARKPGPPKKFRDQILQEAKDASLEEEKEEEPDRLSLLLPNSKFDCREKETGYYADDSLDCEVFHYCEDNVRHSWICPEGFTYHQVHLVCMPPTGDNICAKSPDFHFVNKYLYKPVNAEEVQSNPNITLRYYERYYPENYYDEDHQQQQQPQQQQQQQYVHRKQPIQTGFSPRQQAAPQQQIVAVLRRPVQKQKQQQQQQQQQQQYNSPTLRPDAQYFRPTPANQVFRSAEEVNISLQQRRPYVLGPTTYRAHQARDQEIEYE